MAAQRRVTFSRDIVDDLRKMLREAPNPPDDKPEEYSKLELVRDLAPELRALAKRGWSYKALAAMMSQRVAIGPNLLQSYLRDCTRAARKAKVATTRPTTSPERPGAREASPARAVPQSPRVPGAHAAGVKSAPVEDLLTDDAWITDEELTTGPVRAP
jgi:hypothetical protein